MTTLIDSECSSVANLLDVNDFDDLQVPEYVEIEEVRHVEYDGPYMYEYEMLKNLWECAWSGRSRMVC